MVEARISEVLKDKSILSQVAAWLVKLGHRRRRLKLALERRLQKAYWPAVILSVFAGGFVWANYDSILARFCYDLPFVTSQPVKVDEIALVVVNDETFRQPNYNRGPDGTLDRKHFVHLLDTLEKAKPKLVVMDLVLASKIQDADTDRKLGELIRQGEVFVGAGYIETPTASDPPIRVVSLPPSPSLSIPSNQVGLIAFRPIDPDFVIRTFGKLIEFDQDSVVDLPDRTTLIWKAARFFDGNKVERASQAGTLWLNYRGRPGDVFRKVALHEITNHIDELQGKVVFVGGDSTLGVVGATMDIFGNPWTRFGGKRMPGVEIHATAFDNILCGDWLSRPGKNTETVLGIISGGVFALSLCCFRSGCAFLIGAALGLGGVAIGLLTHRWLGVWFNWLAVWEFPVLATTLTAIWINRRELGWPVVFISYHHTSGGALANAFHAELALAGKAASMDKEIGAEQFPERLLHEIQDAPNFLLLLTGNAVQRLHDPEDWVRQEINQAFATDRTIIIVNAVTEPLLEERNLPNELKKLMNYHHRKYEHANHADIVKWVIRELQPRSSFVRWVLRRLPQYRIAR
ncbi:MAG: CHASE2 domain-containing protein [Verrucomicrobia bacterium]|nr:CHASE2 domain-containing protein [Verrucomicrobiota bacterium]